MPKRYFSLVVLLVSLAFSSLGSAQSVMITEFMAENLTSNYRDEDGERNDWLELQNMTAATVNLNGWYLTDDASDLRKWRFPLSAPAVNLAPGARLVIWCSNKNRKANATRLHTNFRLDKDGEFLGLVKPDGVTVEHAYGPKFPPQFLNGTYGVVVEYETTVLLPEVSQGKARVPQSADDYSGAMAGWNSLANFDDSGWQSGEAGFGYGTAFTSLIGAGGDVSAIMKDVNASLCVRFKFELPDLSSVAATRLLVKYDDGYACFLNGLKIAHGLAPTALEWNSTNLLSIARPDASAFTAEKASFISNPIPALVQGTNVLAFQLLNTSASSASDPNTILRAQFEMDVAVGLTTGYLTTPTPGAENSAMATAIGPAIDQVTKNPPARPVGGAGSAPIVVTAKVTPTLRPLAATNPVVLKWRRMHQAEATVNMTLDEVTGLYTGSVPTTSLQPGEMIRWRVEARDNGTPATYGYAPQHPFSATSPPSNPPPPNLTADLDQYYGTVAQDSITTSKLPILHWFAANPANADGTTGEGCSLFFQPIAEHPEGTPGYTPPAPRFYDNVPIYRHGQSTSGGAFPQKSHNVSLNKENRFAWKDGEPEVRGFNLLTTWADKAKLRHSLAYDTWAKTGHIASHFSQTVRVQLNGSFRGIYEMVEDGNEDFLQREGLDPLGSLYKVYNSLENANLAVNNSGGSEKKNPDTTDFSDLQAFVTGISDSQAMTTRLRYAYDNVDIASAVNFLAVHALIMNRDTGHKNYYVFRDTAKTGEWSPLPWDQDLSFGHTWTSAQNYFDDDIHSQGPLQLGGGNRLNQIVFGSPELNAMFVARIRSLADQFFVSNGETNGPLEQKINEMLDLLDPNPNNPATGTDDADLAARQWGFWVDGSSAAISYTDPRMADHTVRAQAARILSANPIPPYPGANPYSNWGDNSTSLLPFLPGRRAFIFANPPPRSGSLPVPASPPVNPSLVIEGIDFNPAAGTQDQEFFIIRNPNNYAVDISGWKLSGEVEMTFRGGTVIPGQGTPTTQGTNSGYVNQLIVARKPLGFRQRTTSPRANEYRYVSGPYKGQLSARGGPIVLSRPNNLFDPAAGYAEVATTTYAGAPTASQQFLRISELHYAPAAATQAEGDALPGVSGSDFEFIEILNAGAATLNLANAKFDRGVEFVFPSGTVSQVGPGERRLIVSNLTAFRLRYGTGYDGIILGEYLGNLSNGGEELQLLDPAGEVALEFSYDPTWHAGTNGGGLSLEALTTDHTLFGTAPAWRASLQAGGSPGSISPTISEQPVGKVLNPGQPITLSVTASASPAPTYQWRRNGEPILNANGPVYSVLAVAESDEGTYDVLVTNEGGTLPSAQVIVSVNDPVVITEQPGSKTVNPGTQVTFTVAATGTGQLTYQWRKGGQDLEGETGTTLEFVAEEEDEGDYDVVVTNIVGPEPSAAATLSVNDPVSFVQHPQPQTVNPGTPMELTVVADGTGPFTYQWRKNGGDLDGETSATLSLPGIESSEGTYDVVVGNIVGFMPSNAAVISVNDPVVILADPLPVTVDAGGQATFSVQAQGTPVLTYQWRKGGAPIDGATGDTYTIPVVGEEHLGSYDVVVTNIVGSVPSAAVELKLVNWPDEAGNYQGLLAGPDLADPQAHPRPGRVTLAVTKKGKASGKLEYLGGRHLFRVDFDANLSAQNVQVKRGKLAPVTLQLRLDAVNDVLEVSASDGTLESTAGAPHIPARLRNVPPAKMGRYTVLLDATTGAPANLTAPGFLTVNVAKNGSASWAGKMPDSAVVRGSAWLAADDTLAFYAGMYSPRAPEAGTIAGPLAITGTAISGEVAWHKPPQRRGNYWPGGLSALLSAQGTLFVPPARGASILPNVSALQLELEGPIPNGAAEWNLQFTAQNKFLFPPNSHRLKLTVNRVTGAMKGGYYDVAARKLRKLEGVLLQSEECGAGFFLGADTAGSWDLAAPLAEE